MRNRVNLHWFVMTTRNEGVPQDGFRGKMLPPRSQRPGPDGLLIFAMVSGRYLNQAVSGEYVATRQNSHLAKDREVKPIVVGQR
jgi:hypothetical protein